MNRICLVGRLGADPIIKKAGDTTIAELRVATNRRTKVGAEWQTVADWHAVTVFGKAAEFLAERAHKGATVEVTGQLTYRTYTAKDGQERTVAEIKADDAQVVAPARQAAPTSDEHDEAPRAPSRRPTTGQRRDTDDIPF